MIAEQKLSLKTLDQRLRALEEAEYTDAPPEWLDDVLTGVIAALRQLRQQGAYNLALELEEKYFPDGVVGVGDELTTSSGLNRSRAEGMS